MAFSNHSDTSQGRLEYVSTKLERMRAILTAAEAVMDTNDDPPEDLELDLEEMEMDRAPRVDDLLDSLTEEAEDLVDFMRQGEDADDLDADDFMM